MNQPDYDDWDAFSDWVVNDPLAARDLILWMRSLLIEANLAFDDATGDYPKELVEDEPWRSFHPDHEAASGD